MIALRALPTQQVATYQSRDQKTGLRVLKSADGGIAKANYLSTTEPDTVPFYSPGQVGIPGFINNR